MKKPPPNPTPAHPTSVALVRLTYIGRRAQRWVFSDQHQTWKQSRPYADQNAAVKAALEAGWRVVIDGRGTQLAKVTT